MMRSKAHIGSHPIHAILVAFPIASIVGAAAFDAAGLLRLWPSAWTTGAYLSIAAVVTGIVAAVPGLVDYLMIVPPDSSASRRATWHMVVNVLALTAFAAGWAFRDWNTLRPAPLCLALEVVGLALVSGGGWLGGTLVFRNQIGVDHRYADAGKWKEVSVRGRAGEAVEVARSGEMAVGQMKLVVANGSRILLARLPDGYAACSDRCTHKGASLADGVSACGQVVCPWHGSTFDLHNGAVVSGPAAKPIATYKVVEEGGRVLLTLP